MAASAEVQPPRSQRWHCFCLDCCSEAATELKRRALTLYKASQEAEKQAEEQARLGRAAEQHLAQQASGLADEDNDDGRPLDPTSRFTESLLVSASACLAIV